jgi:hypothetical protein
MSGTTKAHAHLAQRLRSCRDAQGSALRMFNEFGSTSWHRRDYMDRYVKACAEEDQVLAAMKRLQRI